MTSLEGWDSAIELHPHDGDTAPVKPEGRRPRWSRISPTGVNGSDAPDVEESVVAGRDPGGDEDTFHQVFDRTLPVAERIAFRITGDHAVSEELAAEALTRLYVSWWRLSSTSHREAWVLRVTTNLAIDVVRRRRRQIAVDFGASTTPDDAVLVRMALAEALSRLPNRQRQVVVLRYLSDLSETDVAVALGVSVGSVKTHLHRALAALRASLQLRDDEDVEVRLAVEP